MGTTISVTVPVYNTSKYLKQCLDSLSAQTLPGIEFILVDDGSTDESGRVCDEYGALDPRFKVIHQQNGGLAAARQTGLDNASGEYIIVCDSDDWVEPNMYELLYNKACETNADIVICGYFAEYADGQSNPCQTAFVENQGFVDNFDFLKRGANSSWVKLIRKSLFRQTDTQYEPGISLSEDSLIVYKLMRGNPSVVQIKKHLYHYRRLFGGQSYTNNVKMAHLRQMYFTYNWFKDNYSDTLYEPLHYKRAVDLAFACIRATDLDKTFFYDFLKKELRWRAVFSNRLTIKSMMVMIEKVFPLAVSKTILKMLYKHIYK